MVFDFGRYIVIFGLLPWVSDYEAILVALAFIAIGNGFFKLTPSALSPVIAAFYNLISRKFKKIAYSTDLIWLLSYELGIMML